ncbi:24527_t:CDS:2, partial [Dentiscutata erythropus]
MEKPSKGNSVNKDDENSQKIVSDEIYYIVKLKKWFKSWEYLQSSSNVHSIIICLLSLAVGIFLYIAEKNNMMSEVRSIISTSIFGTGSLATLLGSLFALKNILYKSRLDTLDVLFDKEEKVPRRKIQWAVKSRIDHVKIIVNYENEFLSELLEEVKDIFVKMKDTHASNFMAEIAKCYKIRDMKFINELLNELSNFVHPKKEGTNATNNEKKEISIIEITNIEENELNDEHDKHMDKIAKQKKLIEIARNVLNNKHDEHMNKYKEANQMLIDMLEKTIMKHAAQIKDAKAIIKLINMVLNVEEKIANEQIKNINASNKMVEIITNYKNEDMTLIDTLISNMTKKNMKKIDDETYNKKDEDEIAEKDTKKNANKKKDKETCNKDDEDRIEEEDIKKNADKKKDKETFNEEKIENRIEEGNTKWKTNNNKDYEVKDTKKNTNES